MEPVSSAIAANALNFKPPLQLLSWPLDGFTPFSTTLGCLVPAAVLGGPVGVQGKGLPMGTQAARTRYPWEAKHLSRVLTREASPDYHHDMVPL